MIMKSIAIGVDDFRKFRQQDSYYVDKSLFVEAFVKSGAEAMMFPRPRRFGKTLNMTMLKYFFDIEEAAENRPLFEGLAIEKTETFEKHQGKYPVVYLSLKSCKGDSFQSFFTLLKDKIASLYAQNIQLATHLSEADKAYFNNILSQKASKEAFMVSLYKLSYFLNLFYNQKVILLIDEYDTPIHEAYLNGHYDETVGFLKALMGDALKGNPYLYKSAITGILRISKESMFSDLNNLEVQSILSNKFNTYFGFTQNEVGDILMNYNLSTEIDNVKKWYDGYYFGDEDIYNPWSIINFVNRDGVYNNYWINTSSNDLVHSFIRQSDESIKKIIGSLLNNEEVFSVIDENVSFKNIENSKETIISFFLQTGYLKGRFVGKLDLKNNYKIEIPNNELRIIYNDIIVKWFDDTIGNQDYDNLIKSLLNADLQLFNRLLSNYILESLSYFNLPKKTKEVERIYQAFLLGILVSLRKEYEITSEKESGYGRYDIAIVPKDKTKRAIIMELKAIDDFNEETTEQALDSALKQINDRQYEVALRQQGCTEILKLAVTFDGKRVWTKMG